MFAGKWSEAGRKCPFRSFHLRHGGQIYISHYKAKSIQEGAKLPLKHTLFYSDQDFTERDNGRGVTRRQNNRGFTKKNNQ